VKYTVFRRHSCPEHLSCHFHEHRGEPVPVENLYVCDEHFLQTKVEVTYPLHYIKLVALLLGLKLNKCTLGSDNGITAKVCSKGF
jgi:hypothetical protein